MEENWEAYLSMNNFILLFLPGERKKLMKGKYRLLQSLGEHAELYLLCPRIQASYPDHW